jgi:hypothetical protein
MDAEFFALAFIAALNPKLSSESPGKGGVGSLCRAQIRP